MKRELNSRQDLVRHEAGHLVATSILSRPAVFLWRRLTDGEIAHVEPTESDGGKWEIAEERNSKIALSVAIALAGGAAEYCAAGLVPDDHLPARTIHAFAGAIDFELAHEWLTLQRYDGHQDAIEADLCRLFADACRLLERPAQRCALARVETRLLDALREADDRGAAAVEIPASRLIEGLALDDPPRLVLDATVVRHRANEQSAKRTE